MQKEIMLLYWQQIRKYKPSFFTMLFAIPVAALLLDTALPYFLSQAVGTLANSESTKLNYYLLLAGAVSAAGVVFNLIGYQAGIRHEIRVRHNLASDTLQRLLAKDRDFFSNQKIGALTGRFIDFINAHVGLQDLFVIRTLTFIITMGSGIIILFISTPLIGAIMTGLIVLLLLQIRLSLKLRMPYRQARKRLVAELNGAVADTITNYMTVKAFAREKHELVLINDVSRQYTRAYLRDFRWMSIEGSLRLAIMATTQIVAIAIVAQLLLQGRIELGIAIFAIAYLQRIATQLFTLGEIINGYDKLFLQAAPMAEILTATNTVKDAPRARQLRVNQGRIAFNSVSYAYGDAKHTSVITSLDLTIKPGEKIGLVGHSGAGKTTITQLLLRFADTDAGTITIDGQDIAKVTQESLREAIAFVPQEPMLFHRTLHENIAYGRPNANVEDTKEAARKAQALDFIERQPAGFDTVVGERGVKLSGGQRQRIAIARAILKDAPILVLDEATSALDSESEKSVQKAMVRLMEGKTAIVIAHRLSTIQQMDRIIVLDNGSIIEQGSHAELLHRGGVYANLWRHQSGGFIEE